MIRLNTHIDPIYVIGIKLSYYKSAKEEQKKNILAIHWDSQFEKSQKKFESLSRDDKDEMKKLA